MNKKELIISKLEELKNIYKQQSDKKWNMRALSIAIDSIKNYNEDIKSGEKLKDIKGIGEKIGKRIDEILETGNLKELNNGNSNNNGNGNSNGNGNEDSISIINNLLDITGVGLVRAKKWIEMGVKDIEDVKKLILEKKIESTHHIDIGIKYYNDFKQRIERSEIDKMKNIIKKGIEKVNNKIIFEICGSYRRGLETSGDIDILISHKDYIENICEQKFLEKIIKELKKDKFIIDYLTEKGNTKFMGVCKIDSSKYARRIDIRVVDYKSYYTSLLYFTGNKNFNIYIRNKALEKKYSLNEYGLIDIRDDTIRYIESERDIFKILDIEYKRPNERENY
jgi:DNA polymerase beta